jgi:hypothetical protein
MKICHLAPLAGAVFIALLNGASGMQTAESPSPEQRRTAIEKCSAAIAQYTEKAIEVCPVCHGTGQVEE